MNYVIEMESCAITCILCLIKIGLGIQKLIVGLYIQTHRPTHTEKVDLITLFLFKKKSRLKIITSFIITSHFFIGTHVDVDPVVWIRA
jgi:hypothetical protein